MPIVARSFTLCACALLSLAAAAAAPDGFPPITPMATPAQPGAIALYPELVNAPYPENWGSVLGEAMARNVTIPTLTPVLPPAGKANGTAMVVAPGGAFMALSMDSEGFLVARALAEQGVTAFVLKYRLKQTPVDPAGFAAAIGAVVGRRAARQDQPGDLATPPEALADAQQAMRLVRSRASQWGIDPGRVGFVGFSAGAMTALSLTLQSGADARPDFVAPIYPPMSAVTVPADAPPLFVALATDDPLFGGGEVGLVTSWLTAKRPVELHYFERGGHGFGMHQQGTTTDRWFDALLAWMRMHDWVGSKAGAPALATQAPAFDPAALEAEMAIFNKLPDTVGTGPYPALKEMDSSLPDHVVYRPKDFSQLGRKKLGVLAWGNGGCAADGAGARMHLAEIASHGYLVIANGRILSGPGAPEQPRNALPAGAPPAGVPADGARRAGMVLPPPATKAGQLIESIDWALAQNARKGSLYFGRIDPKQIAVSGWSCGGLQSLQVASDPRIRTLIIHNSGIFNAGFPGMPGMDISKDALKALHTPILYVLGGPTDIAYTNGMDDFERINQVPVFVANLDVGHGGTFLKANGGQAASVALSWLDWQLKGNRQAALRFTGANCGLCRDKDWTVKRKNLP
jgi:dienelactone hydrolase